MARRGGLVEGVLRVGWTRLLSRMTKDRDCGSMTSEVPVKPVCPRVCGPDRPPMYQIWSSSKPRPCESPGNAWLKFCSISRTLFPLRMRWPLYVPPLRIVWASTARSSTVEKTPAWPATPPSAQAFSSCTWPHTMPRAGLVWYSVAAIRGSSPAGGL